MREFNLFSSTKFVNRLTYLLGGLSVLIVLFSALYYIAFNWFKVDHIIIEGNVNPVTANQIAKLADTDVEGTLFTLNIENLRLEFKGIPWVKNVVVSRQFPSSIVIDVEGYNALARFGDGGYFVATNGDIFYGVTDNNFVLPTFYVPTNELSAVVALYNQSRHIFMQQNVTLSKLYWLGPNITRVVLSNDLQVMICGGSVADRLMLLNHYWGPLYQLNPKLNYVNMCYRNSVAINSPTNTHIQLQHTKKGQKKI